MNKQERINSVKLSQTSKMPCLSYNLKAVDCCVVNCDYCYAKTGRYLFSNVVNTQLWRDNDWKQESWASRMVTALSGEQYFRWFDSGDLYCQDLINKVYQVCLETPQVRHWIATKAYMKPLLDLSRLESLDNLALRYSGMAIDKPDQLTGKVRALILTEPNGDYGHICKATTTDIHKCLDCRACWDKSQDTIEYKLH